jgi:HAD superfamily hydrolase (TIGR01484 family)
MTFADWKMIMVATKLFVFDLDDTLAPSKQPIPVEIQHLLVRLVEKYQIAILTGGQYQQVRKQVLEQLPDSVRSQINVFSCSGSQYALGDGSVQTDLLLPEDAARIKLLVEKVAIELGFWCEDPDGPIIEDRLSQITFSALGQLASPERKSGWDRDRSKRQAMVDRLVKLLPEYSFGIGGSTSIDVTMPGRDKRFGMERILELLSVDRLETVFVGDSFEPSGNDYPVLDTGVFCLQVNSWSETADLMRWLEV